MAQRLVFRIEKPSQNHEARTVGPYIGGMYLGPSHNDPKTHPSPYSDKALEPERSEERDLYFGYLGITPDEICGLDSLRSVERWFKGNGIALSDAGYWITAYSVEDQFIRQGKKQLVFSQKHATPIHKMDPAHFISQEEKEDD